MSRCISGVQTNLKAMLFGKQYRCRSNKVHKMVFWREALSTCLTLSLPRSSIDDIVFLVLPSKFFKLSYKISLIKNRFVTLFFIQFS